MPPPRNLPDPGITPKYLLCLLHWPAGSLSLAPPGKPKENLRAHLYLRSKVNHIGTLTEWLIGDSLAVQ